MITGETFTLLGTILRLYSKLLKKAYEVSLPLWALPQFIQITLRENKKSGFQCKIVSRWIMHLSCKSILALWLNLYLVPLIGINQWYWFKIQKNSTKMRHYKIELHLPVKRLDYQGWFEICLGLLNQQLFFFWQLD